MLDFPFNCVCIALVTPSKYPSSVLVTADDVTLPLLLDINALFASKLVLVIDAAPPVIVACFLAKSLLY